MMSFGSGEMSCISPGHARSLPPALFVCLFVDFSLQVDLGGQTVLGVFLWFSHEEVLKVTSEGSS